MTEGDGKQDVTKAADKARPTAEQMRIAQIIDTKSEDPTLKEKIRQVMDATQKSEDEVCAALFDCDNDPDRAVNLLLEGVQSEWSTSKKKKKRGEKTKDAAGQNQPQQDDSDWDVEGAEDAVPIKAVEMRGRGGRGPRGTGRGQDRWRSRGDGEDHDRSGETERERGGRRGRGSGGGRGRGGRSFGRGRPPFRRPVETWDPSTADGHDAPDPVDDWDNEVYTGSLADSKVFTPSNVNNTLPEPAEQEAPREPALPSAPVDEGRQSLSAAQYLSQFASNRQTNKVGNSQNSSVFHETHYPADPFATTFGVNTYSSSETESNVLPCEDVRLQRIPPLTKIRARIPPPSKIPSSAVEMPPDAVGGSMALLDVQFGALDFGDNNEGVQQPSVSTPPQTSPSPTTSDKLANPTTISVTELISSDSSFSPVRSTGSSSVTPQINDLSSTKSGEGVQSAFGQETVYPTSQFSKSSHSQPSSFANSFTSTQATSNSSGYNAVNSTNNYSTTSAASYTNSAYPQYQSYSSYPSHSQALTATPHLHSTNSYQSGTAGYGGTQNSVYSTTSSYSTPYQSYSVNPQHNAKTPLSSVSSGNKDFETPSNLNSISQSTTISAPSLSTSTQTTCASKPSAMNTTSKALVAGMPPGVPPIVGPQYIMSQGGMPYFQQPLYGYEELQLLPQQRLPPHLPGGYYEVGYQAPTTREGVQYNISDARLARADNNTSPVQVTSINQQSGTQGHQQPLMNPSTIQPTYAYFYGGSVIPGNFQYGAPTFYPTGTGSGHSSSSGIYSKGLAAAYTGGYGSYEGGQGSTGDYKGPNQAPKTQSAQTNPAGSSDIYSKTHAALSKSYEKSGFHSGTPPPFTLSSQNSGMGPTGGYPPQHLFIPPMTQHNTPMMHHPLQQEPGTRGAQPSKVGAKTPNYSPSAYWTPN